MSLRAILFVVVLGGIGPGSYAVRTWSGGHAGISLNASGFTIYEASGDGPGQLSHWWVTGGNKTLIDNAIVEVFVDGEAKPSVSFTPCMAGGTGFVDDATPCALGNCPEKNSNWGNQWIGKGSGMGGWYNDLRVPFNTSLRATVRSPFSTMPVSKGRSSSSAPSCSHVVNNTDFWGNDLPGKQITGVAASAACCELCGSTTGCAAWSWHPAEDPMGDNFTCFLKDSAAGAKPSPGIVSGTVPAWSLREGFDFWGSDIGNVAGVASVADCAAHCSGNAQCAAFTYYNTNDLTAAAGVCFLKTAGAHLSEVPSSPTATSGCMSPIHCTHPTFQDSSIFTLIRGVYGKGVAPVSINGVELPSNARLTTQFKAQVLQPLDYYSIVNVSAADAPTGGAVAMTTLAVVSGTANFMEGCFHAFLPLDMPFPGYIMATGTEDLYNSGYYFIDAYPQHLPSTGFTFNVPFKESIGPLTTGGMRWSAYRLFMEDQLMWESGGGAFTWRNGDVAQPGIGKCHVQGTGPPVGSPTQSFVRSLAYVYVY